MELLTRSMTWESDGVVSLELVDPAGGDLPAWEPGAHLDLHAGDVERQYSLCGDPRDRSRYLVAVLLEEQSRGGSAWVHATLRPGAVVTIGGPRNSFPLRPAPEYLFIGGGIGITPLLPMIDAVDRKGLPWRLVYGGRRGASMAFTQRLAAYGDRVTLWPQDERGIIDLATVLAPAADLVVYCCGPEPLLAAVEQRWPHDRLHIERFAPKETVLEGPDEAFEIELSSSGQRFEVPAGTSILKVLVANGFDPDYSCLEGICGACETSVLAGVPDHRDSILDDKERAAGATMMICVSRSTTPRLVLDL